MNNVNFAVIGTNFISDWFVGALREVEEASVCAVLSRTRHTGEAFANKHGIGCVYTSLEKMLEDPTVNAVYVASPTYMHYTHAMAAIRAGKHVLCEKMIALRESEFVDMRMAAEEKGVVLLEAMRPDFDGAHDLIKANLSSIGRIRRAEFKYCQYSSRYDRFKSGEILNAFDPSIKNSALADIGVYALHTCISYFGAPASVSSHSVFLENGFEGAGVALLSYDGMSATVSYSKIADNMTPSVIEGELGSITFDSMNAPRNITLNLRGKAPETIPFLPKDNNMSFEIAAFCEMISGKRSAEKYLDLTAKTMSTVERIYECSGIDYV